MNPQTPSIRQPEPPQVHRAGGGQATFTVQLSSTRRGARSRGLFAAQWLDERGVPFRCTTAHSAALIVAELAANAVRHCGNVGRDFRLRLDAERGGAGESAAGGGHRRSGGQAAADEGRPGRRRTPEESGRGLVLVDALADRWGDRVNDLVTKTLWAELKLPV